MKIRIAVFLLIATTAFAEVPENFRPENLVAWCIVPFDAEKRGPAARAEMVERLGLRRVAYDWRKEHVAEFETEILEYKKHGLEYFAFWNQHEEASALFKKHGISPQTWITVPSPDVATQDEKVKAAADRLQPLAKKVGVLGLYNHGGWGGEPENMIAVCEELRRRGFEKVGIVYNFHHGHEVIDTWAEDFGKLQPYLLCLNLNGMFDLSENPKKKLAPIGTGPFEAEMIQTVVKSGYQGPVGILGHVKERDVEVVLRENMEGVAKILE